jgi:hypothetical protein
MKILRWIFLVLYVLILIGLFGLAYSNGVAGLFYPLVELRGFNGNLFWTVFTLAVTMISQVLFMFSAGKIDLQRPKNKYIVLVPIAVASIALATLMYFFLVSAVEFFRREGVPDWLGNFPAMFICIGTCWIMWGIIFYMRLKNAGKYKIYENILSALIAGSVLEFLPAVLMHMVVSKRHECFAGMYTGLGVSFGLVIMLWSFGPGIIFLFIRAKDKAELREKARKIIK